MHQEIEVVVADRVAPEESGIPFVAVDLAQPETLEAALTGADTVINTAGPFDRWGATVLDVAIELGVDYIDVCDDPEPTLELLDRNDAAQARGVRAIVGLGVSPGLTNFLAMIAAQRLDTADLLTTFWGDPAEGMGRDQAVAQAAALASSFEAGRAAYTHLIVQTSSEVPVWRSHALTREQAWLRAYRVTTAAGETGVYRVIGHPEPVTLPATLDVGDCLNIGTVNAGTDSLMLPVLARVAAGEIEAEEAIAEIASQLRGHPERIMTERVGDALPRNLGAAAVGSKGGVPDGVIVFPGGPLDGSMSLETARPAVVGALLLTKVQPGVHAPETAFDAETYLAYYSRCYWGGEPAYRVDSAGAEAVKEVLS